ncbi:hypothetical protein ANN_06873 [Periplaneta americana]|uniref:Uncharacterized protein n=1 Tax=Periplaneta americana TaxID=6978 RepID=A0ABQ8TEU7_PERAM|nr:hypothetical protein ANN_06873 [Periplaneta americana]
MQLAVAPEDQKLIIKDALRVHQEDAIKTYLSKAADKEKSRKETKQGNCSFQPAAMPLESQQEVKIKTVMVATFFFALMTMENSKIKQIDHKVLVLGHTLLGCDSDHSVIEGKKEDKYVPNIPPSWLV